MTSERKVRYGIHHQKKEKLFYCLYLCGRERRDQAEMGNPHFLSGGIEAQGGDREPEKLQLLPAATNQNIAEFLSDFVSLYGEKRWGVSMYDSQNSLIANYINPIIGDMKVQDITTRVVDKYIQTLQKTPAVNTRRTTPKRSLSPTLPSRRSSNFSAVPSSRRFGGNWLPRTPLTMWCCQKWNTRSGTSGLLI